MRLKMKDFDVLGVHWKIGLLGGWSSQKSNIEGGIAWKGGPGQFADLGGGAWQERGGWCFWGGGAHTPMHTMCSERF